MANAIPEWVCVCIASAFAFYVFSDKMDRMIPFLCLQYFPYHVIYSFKRKLNHTYICLCIVVLGINFSAYSRHMSIFDKNLRFICSCHHDFVLYWKFVIHVVSLSCTFCFIDRTLSKHYECTWCWCYSLPAS